MSGSGLFGVARSALLTHQTALHTISQNIANAETPGYSRQEAVLSATMPVRMPYGSVGTGVTVDTIVRRRDVLLDDTFRSANGSASQSEMQRDLLARIEQMFGEPTDEGMSASLDAFFNAWSELATSPGNSAAREVVQQRGRQLAQKLNDYDNQLTQQRTSATDRLNTIVAEANALAGQVAELNGQIVSSEIGGHVASDLRDQRDILVDRLSSLVGARTIPQVDGSVSVIVGSSTLVDSNTARPLTLELVVPNPPPATPVSDLPVRIRLGNSPDPILNFGGEMKALVQHVNSVIPEMRGRLDAVASGLASAVNAEHVQNFVFSGNTIPGTAAGNFFDPGTVTSPVRAGTIRLSNAVAADPSAIAISRVADAPFDNTGGRALSELRSSEASVSFTNSSGITETGSFVSFFRDSVSRLGLELRSARDDASIRRVLADQANLRRESVSGVNTDEELVKMMRVQQSYTAATKLIQAADEMLDTLLSLV